MPLAGRPTTIRIDQNDQALVDAWIDFIWASERTLRRPGLSVLLRTLLERCPPPDHQTERGKKAMDLRAAHKERFPGRSNITVETPALDALIARLGTIRNLCQLAIEQDWPGERGVRIAVEAERLRDVCAAIINNVPPPEEVS